VPADVLTPQRTLGRLIVNPRHHDRLAALGCDNPLSLLDLPGEVVSGHPDRHVVRVELPGIGTCYLKRQHRVGWRERFGQWLAGFGWVSRCEREAAIIRELEASGFAAPEWVAHGEHGGRAFLLVEELADAVELRRLLSDTRLSAADRNRLAGQLGRQVAELHATGFTTPDLTAKHVFVNPLSFAVTLIDWQNSRRSGTADMASLAALHASLADDLADARDRLRFLRAYRRHLRTAPRFSTLVRDVLRGAARVANRRSIRDQRQPVVTATDQRLVWLAGEATCAVPDVAAVWPNPPIAAPFYGEEPAELTIELPDGRPAVLLRGRSIAPLARLQAWLRGRPWRSPGATLGRILFHLERYGIAAPRLFAFGQRQTGPVSAEWFALYEPPPGRPPSRQDLDPCLVLLGQLHAAGCRPDFRGRTPFRVGDTGVSVGDPRGIRIVRRLTARDRRADVRRLHDSFTHPSRAR
jgi:tRNA A-37 threonylcarbamoyl transferase component Bud32